MLDNSRIGIPEHTFEALKRYVEHRLPPGGFLEAVLTNNFIETVGRADDQNSEKLKEIAEFVYWELPGSCWGSPEKVREWLEVVPLQKAE